MKTLYDMLRDWFRQLILKPYGDNLCTPGAKFWIFCVRIMVALMAITEGVTWAYLGSFFGGEGSGMISAIMAGSFIFLLIWIVDATFVTLDLSFGINVKVRKKSGTILGHLKEYSKLSGGFISRLVIVISSLLITAPYLSQVVLQQDINSAIFNNNSQIRAGKRSEILNEYDESLSDLVKQRNLFRKRSADEAAGVTGTGLSGIYGHGDASKIVEIRLNEIYAEISNITDEKTNALREFDTLSYDQLTERYGLNFAKKGLEERGKVLDELMNTTSFVNAELAVRAFLAFLFFGLIILKIFQPKSIRVYYDEYLQDNYKNYLVGKYDKWLDKLERSHNPEGMSPLRFANWYRNIYSVIAAQDARKREKDKVTIEHNEKIQIWNDEINQIENILAPMREKYEMTVRNKSIAQNELSKSESEIKTIEKKLDDGRILIKSFEDAIRNNRVAGNVLSTIINKQTKENSYLIEAEASLRSHHIKIETLTSSITLLASDEDEIHDQMILQKTLIMELTKKIADERKEFSDKIKNME